MKLWRIRKKPLPIAGGPQPSEKFSVHSLGDRDWGSVSVCNPYPMILRGLSNCDSHLKRTLKLGETWLLPKVYACGYLLVLQWHQLGVLDEERHWEGNLESYKVPGFPKPTRSHPKAFGKRGAELSTDALSWSTGLSKQPE